MNICEPSHPIWKMVNPQKPKTKWIGTILIPIGNTTLFIGGMMYYLGKSREFIRMIHTDYLTYYVIMTAAFCFGLCLSLLGKRLLQMSAKLVLLNDSRRPVLYLRAFIDDKETHNISKISYNYCDLDNLETEEELLVKAFWSTGPVITIGKPGEFLPQTGAARLYVNNNNWKAVVSLLIDEASLIVIRFAETDGIKWELSYVLNRLFEGRFNVVLIVPSENSNASAYLCKEFGISETRIFNHNQGKHFQDILVIRQHSSPFWMTIDNAKEYAVVAQNFHEQNLSECLR